MSEPATVPVAEQFDSIQGEGRYMGHPAVFLRTAGCNLLCGGAAAADAYAGTEYEDQTRAMAENLGDEEPGTWVCDTIAEWLDGDGRRVEELYREWADAGFLAKIDQGAHVVLTGGEPLLHQEELTAFLDLLASHGHDPFVEVETNATIAPSDAFREHVDQFNLSPKLANAGLERAARYRPEVIEEYVSEFTGDAASDATADFKFVVGDRDDWQEIETAFRERFDIPRANTYLMPAGANQDSLGLTRAEVVELAVEHSVQFSERLQIVIWDEATGV